MRALLLALAWALPAAAQDRCLVACDEATEGLEAAERLAVHLDYPLPDSVQVVGLVEGGFQDAFIQARLEVPEGDLTRLLSDLALDPAELAPRRSESFGPTGFGWWDAETRDGLLVGYGDLNAYDWTLVGVTPSDEGVTTVYLWAFQT